MARNTLIFSLAGALALDFLLNAHAPALAAISIQPTDLNRQSYEISLNFKPRRRGTPRTTAGGATRSFCVIGSTPLTILAPEAQPGLTTVSHPTFFVYVPHTVAKSAEFVIKNDQDEDIYRSSVEIKSDTAGILQIKLPENAPALETGESYKWYFALKCNVGDRLNDALVSAWITREAPDLELQSKLNDRSSPREKAEVYADAGYWYDTLAQMALLRQSNPNSAQIQQEWAQLLESVKLNQVTTAPLLP